MPRRNCTRSRCRSAPSRSWGNPENPRSLTQMKGKGLGVHISVSDVQ